MPEGGPVVLDGGVPGLDVEEGPGVSVGGVPVTLGVAVGGVPVTLGVRVGVKVGGVPVTLGVGEEPVVTAVREGVFVTF